MHDGRVLPGAFYRRNTVTVARDLIGMLLVREIEGRVLTGRIVETEAYRDDDPASHSYKGPRGRCTIMFGPPGIAYVYRSYGVHHLLNVVTEPAGSGCAVLLRAIEPLCDPEILWSGRFPGRPFDPRRTAQLTNGPGKLSQAFGITVEEFYGHPLDARPLSIAEPEERYNGAVVADARIGITRGTEKPWRFLAPESRFLSRRASQQHSTGSGRHASRGRPWRQDR